jgi:hypothetical protein
MRLQGPERRQGVPVHAHDEVGEIAMKTTRFAAARRLARRSVAQRLDADTTNVRTGTSARYTRRSAAISV